MNNCTICNKRFANKNSLSAHKSRYHPKSKKIIPSENKDHEKADFEELLSSINDKLQREVFSLLDAHVFKNEYCSKLATNYFANEAEMKHTLSTNEFWFIDAVCKSEDLETVRKLVYENLDLII